MGVMTMHRGGAMIAPVSIARAGDGLEGVKLLAVVLMATDHLLIALPQPWAQFGFLAGRPCVALFSWILVCRLASGGPDRGLRLLRRLLIWALVAQPAYWALTHAVVSRLSVLATLALGAGLIWLLQTRRPRLAVLGALAALVAGPWLDGGGLIPGAMAAAWWMAVGGRRGWALAILAAASVAHNAVSAPADGLALVLVAAALPLAWMASRWAAAAPRLPGWAFYAFYPAHLALIFLVFGPYG